MTADTAIGIQIGDFRLQIGGSGGTKNRPSFLRTSFIVGCAAFTDKKPRRPIPCKVRNTQPASLTRPSGRLY